MSGISGALRDSAPAHGRPSGGWRELYARYGALAGYLLAGLSVYAGWLGRDQRNINAEYGLGYALGIVGGTLMLVLLLYSVRKRVRALARLGETRHWFRIHMILGVVGPVLILYHCNFELGDLNSKVALYCTLLVAGSGLLGRYLYAGIHHGLYGRKASLRELTGSLEASLAATRAHDLFHGIRARLAALDQRVLEPPVTLAESLLRQYSLAWETRRLYPQLLAEARQVLAAEGRKSDIIRQQAPRLEATLRRYLASHLAQARQVARFNLLERLFALWHIVHVPFFVMMILSGVFHVFAVHLY